MAQSKQIAEKPPPAKVAEKKEILAQFVALFNELGEAEVLRRARARDPVVLPLVCGALDAGNSPLWETWGDLAQIAIKAHLELVASKDALSREAIQRQLAALKRDLAGPNPTPLEGALAERAAVCWLHAYHADACVSWNYGQAGEELRLKRQDRAHRRYLSALKALAQVRRLLGNAPGVQVNVVQATQVVAGDKAEREVIPEDK